MNRFVTIMIILVAIPLGGWCQSDLSSLEFFFDNEINAQPLKIKLISDFKSLNRHKSKPNYQPANVTFYFENGDSVETTAKIKPRGLFRKKYCSTPPIWLNFKKGDFKESSVNEYDKIKLVTHCREQVAYSQNLIQEYYIYKAYEILTTYSFRTRLVKIYYDDTGKNKESQWYYGFLIEDEDQMAVRNDAIPVELTLHSERTNRQMSTIMDVFQYMIGNTDYSVPGLHNIKLLKSNDKSKYNPVSVPYDFDYCGLINAIYAIPPEILDIQSVKERKYRGFCRSDEEFQTVYDLFIQHKSEIINLFQDSALLEKKYKNEAVSYLNEFFKIIESPTASKRYINELCRTNK